MQTFLSNPLKKKQFLLILVDILIVICAFISSYAFRIVVYEGKGLTIIAERIEWLVWAAAFLHVISLYVLELYNLEVKRSAARTFALIVLSVIIATAMVAFLSYLVPHNKLGRVVLTTHIPITVTLIFIWRMVFSAVFQEDWASNNLLIIGDSPLNEEIIGLLKTSPIILGSCLLFMYLRTSPKAHKFSVHSV